MLMAYVQEKGAFYASGNGPKLSNLGSHNCRKSTSNVGLLGIHSNPSITCARSMEQKVKHVADCGFT